MAASERALRRLLPAVALAVAAATFGCASSRAEKAAAREPLPPQMVVQPTPSDAAAPAQPVDEQAGVAAPTSPSRAPADSTLIVIDPADTPAAQPQSLAEAAARERARRDRETKPVLEITNQNLAQHAAGGVLTIAHSTAAEDAAADEAAEAAVAASAEQEKLWRDRGLEIRTRWREAVERVPELEEKVAGLRNQFYATDDPAVRDGQIKPQWDRALADLEEARYQAAKGAEEVAAFLEEGRRAGALPGWLREGSELEPEPVVDDLGEPADHEPREPSIYEPPPGR
jgi:hypothetical protein